MNKICLLFACILIAASITVCGGCKNNRPNPDDSAFQSETLSTQESPTISMTQSPSISPSADTSPVSGSPPASESQKKTIYYIAYSRGTYGLTVQGGVTQAGKDMDCDFIIQGLPDTDIEGQIRLLENAVASGAGAIIINVVDRAAMANSVSAAYQSGIPIVLVDGFADTEDYSACLIIDDIRAGRAAAAEMLRKVKSTGLSEEDFAEIAVQIGVEESQTTRDMLEGFKTYWDENAPLQWVVLWDDVKVNEGDIDKATEIGRDFLVQHPSLKAMFAPNNGSTIGFVAALKETNRTDITLVGFDINQMTEQLIRDEDFNASTLVPPQYKMGYDAMTIALELASGGTVAEKIIDVGVIAVDTENIGNPEIRLWIHGS